MSSLKNVREDLNHILLPHNSFRTKFNEHIFSAVEENYLITKSQ